MHDYARNAMKSLLPWLLLAAALPANAGFMAFADGKATAGCSDCTGAGLFDPFGLGPAADLTGMDFRVIFDISDAALAVTPYVTPSGALRYEPPEAPGYITASIIINGVRYELPADPGAVVMPIFEIATDGSFGAHFQNEHVSATPSGDPSYTYSHLSAFGSETAYFGSFQDVFSGGTHTTPWQTFLSGNIGAFTFQPSVVPEPGTLVLLASGLLGLLFARRRRHSRVACT
jgi:hypothetical protein